MRRAAWEGRGEEEKGAFHKRIPFFVPRKKEKSLVTHLPEHFPFSQRRREGGPSSCYWMGANLLKGSFPKTSWEGKTNSSSNTFSHPQWSIWSEDLSSSSSLIHATLLINWPLSKAEEEPFSIFTAVKANARKKATTILRGKISFPVKTEHFILRTPVIFPGNNCKSTVISASAKELKKTSARVGKTRIVCPSRFGLAKNGTLGCWCVQNRFRDFCVATCALRSP